MTHMYSNGRRILSFLFQGCRYRIYRALRDGFTITTIIFVIVLLAEVRFLAFRRFSSLHTIFCEFENVIAVVKMEAAPYETLEAEPHIFILVTITLGDQMGYAKILCCCESESIVVF